jgi:hypothetical protein
VRSIPSVHVFNEEKLSIGGTTAIAFINSGTRSAEVDSMGISVIQKQSGKALPCNGTEVDLFETDLKPFVIGPGSIELKDIKTVYQADPGWTKGANNAMLFPTRKKFMEDKTGTTVQVCLLFNVNTPSQSYFGIEADLGDYAIDKQMSYMEVDRPVDLDKPTILVHEQHIMGSP